MSEVEQKPKTPGRGVKIALAVSVTLNLLLAGLIAGAVLRHEHGGGPDDDRAAFAPYLDALPRSDRGELRAEMFRRMPDLRDLRRERADDFRAFVTALRAEPFDPDAAEAVLERQVGRAAHRLEEGRDLFLERLTAMSDEDRLAYADRLEKSLSRNRK